MFAREIVGFDAREMWLDVDSQWSQKQQDLWQNKDQLFLRLDVSKSMSVDHYVWHSVFSELSEPRLWCTVARDTRYSGSQWDAVFSEDRKLDRPDLWTPRGLWRQLAPMQDYLQTSWGDRWKPCYVVAVVEIFRDDDDELPGTEAISPNVVDSRWQLLGYDVADYELYTGLFNGQMKPDEAIKLRHDWANSLNEHHLFMEPETAFDYIPTANMRYSSHAPYHVYALYGIQKYNVAE